MRDYKRPFIALAFVVVFMAGMQVAQSQPNWPTMRTTQAFAKWTAGTNTLSVTAEAVATEDFVNECVLQNDDDSGIEMFVGDSASQPFQLSPGENITIPIDDISTLFVVAASGTPVLNYLCR